MEPRKHKNQRKAQDLNQIVEKKVKAALIKNVELKSWTQVKTSTAADYDGICFDLSLVAQGDTDATRDGDRIHLKKIRFSIDVFANVLPSIVRVIIFQWFGADVPGPATVLTLTFQAEIIHSPIEIDAFSGQGGGRGVILHDSLLQVDSNGTVGVGTAPRTLVKTITGGFKPNCQFATGTTVGTNHIYVLLASDRKTTNMPLYRFYSQIRYTDA